MTGVHTRPRLAGSSISLKSSVMWISKEPSDFSTVWSFTLISCARMIIAASKAIVISMYLFVLMTCLN